MSDLFGRILELRNGSAADDREVKSPQTSMNIMLTGLINRNLQRHWAEDEPGDDCFDRDESKMALLLAFIGGTSDEPDNRRVRDHLLQCPRCRFIYVRVRQVARGDAGSSCEREDGMARADGEAVPDLLRDNLRTTGPVIFPGEEVAEGAWEFGLLGEIPDGVAEQICETVAERGWRILRGILPSRGVVLVCFGNPVHRCGKRLAAKMVASGVEDVHVVMADDFFNPKLWCNPGELKDRHVVVFVDVIHSGGLIKRLLAVCRQGEPKDLLGMAIIDQSRGEVGEGPICGFWNDSKERRDHHGGSEGARYFDPVSSRAWHAGNLPAEVSDPQRAKETIESRLRDIRPLFRCIQATGALRQDARIGDVCYPWAIDLLCLLRHEEARGELAKRASIRLADLSGRGPWCIVFPAERHQRAGAWARVLAEALRWPVVGVGLRNRVHFRPLTKGQGKELAQCRRALIVDAAIRSGKTLQSLAGILRADGRPSIEELIAFYAFDGLFDAPRRELETSLNVEIRSLFRLPLGAPTEPVGQYCRQRLRETLDELGQVAGSGPAPWADVVRDYCRRKLDICGRPVRGRPSEDLEASLRQALDEGERGVQARLERACDPPRPSLVKHLDVAYALREPRTRNVLHGFMCNSMPPDFIEACALALAAQEDYGWFDRDWLVLHKRILANPTSQRWEFLVYVGYRARRHGSLGQIQSMRATIEGFRRSLPSRIIPMFADVKTEDDGTQALRTRCDTILSVLS